MVEGDAVNGDQRGGFLRHDIGGADAGVYEAHFAHRVACRQKREKHLLAVGHGRGDANRTLLDHIERFARFFLADNGDAAAIRAFAGVFGQKRQLLRGKPVKKRDFGQAMRIEGHGLTAFSGRRAGTKNKRRHSHLSCRDNNAPQEQSKKKNQKEIFEENSQCRKSIVRRHYRRS